MLLFSVVDQAINYCDHERAEKEKLKRKRAMRV